MLSSTFLTLLMAAQAATPAPVPAAPPPGVAKIQASANALSTCIQAKITAVPADLTPEKGADHVMAACKSEQTALEQAVETMIATAPADRQAAARKQMADSMAAGRTQIAQGLSMMRAAPPAPLPSPPRPQ